MCRTSVLMVLFSVCCAVAVSQAKVKVIYETDMARDVDDTAALGMLHVLADRGEAKILAVMINSSCKDSAKAAHAINRFYGRGNVPIGVYKGRKVDGGKCGPYAKKIGRSGKTQDAKKLYKKILQKNNNVTIISVGFLGNLDRLVRDRYLNSLVRRKVKQLVLMGGKLQGGSEFNLSKSGRGVARHVIDNWPGDIVFSTHSIGAAIRTGSRMQSASGASPVREAYWHYHRRWNALRSSWDQTAVLYAVRGKKTYWKVNCKGGLSVESNGGSRWNKRLRRDHCHLKPRMSTSRLARLIDDLMMKRPK